LYSHVNDPDNIVPSLAGPGWARLFLGLVEGTDDANEAVLLVVDGELRMWDTSDASLYELFSKSLKRFRRLVRERPAGEGVVVALFTRQLQLFAWAEQVLVRDGVRVRASDAPVWMDALVVHGNGPGGGRRDPAYVMSNASVLPSKARDPVKRAALVAAAEIVARALPAEPTRIQGATTAAALATSVGSDVAVRLYDDVAAAMLFERVPDDAAAALRSVKTVVRGGTAVVSGRLRPATWWPRVPESESIRVPDVVELTSALAFVKGDRPGLEANAVLHNPSDWEDVGAVPTVVAARTALLLTDTASIVRIKDVVTGSIVVREVSGDIDLLHLILRGTVTPARIEALVFRTLKALHECDKAAVSAVARQTYPALKSPFYGNRGVWDDIGCVGSATVALRAPLGPLGFLSLQAFAGPSTHSQ
jgi:hypothetical protein